VPVVSPDWTVFADNFERLLGVHRLTARKAGDLLGVSHATLSYWRNARREPDVKSLMRVSAFFEVDAWSLLMLPFPELLPIIADPERFERVERRIAGEDVPRVSPILRLPADDLLEDLEQSQPEDLRRGASPRSRKK
jgi:transcriptional regulator with XRE-family HTH domain